MKHFYLILFLTICLFSCKNDPRKDVDAGAYFGGEIINPSNRYVVILKENNVLDTIQLDQNNRFLYKIQPVQPGLYKFSHGGEIQMFLLEPNDSIMFRLNNIDFDESLVFTGRGARENNYLMNMFLENERVNHNILKYSQNAPKKFEEKLDSIKAILQNKLNQFEQKYNTSPLFNEIAQANIDYNYYAQKEIYPITFFGNTELQNLKSLPKDFYVYRSKIDYNNPDLKEYFPYYMFLRHHFNNLALEKHFSHSKDSTFNMRSLDFNLDKLELIDSLVTNDSIKNYLLNYSAYRYIHSSNNIDDYDTYLKSFLEKSTSPQNNEHLKNFITSLKNLKAGSAIPNPIITDKDNTELHLHDFINGPTAIYFWSVSLKPHFIDSHERIKDLKKKYPEVHFIGLNIDENKENWMAYLNQYHYPLENEYHFKNPLVSRQLLALNSISRVMLVNKNKIIINSNANMFSKYFEEQLLGLINQ